MNALDASITPQNKRVVGGAGPCWGLHSLGTPPSPPRDGVGSAVYAPVMQARHVSVFVFVSDARALYAVVSATATRRHDAFSRQWVAAVNLARWGTDHDRHLRQRQ